MTERTHGEGHHPADAHRDMHVGGDAGLNSMAASATLHCLTGCAVGEILGLIIGTAAGLSNAVTIALSIILAFLFGYALSTLPLVKAGLGVAGALSVVLAADTLSILTMEIFDNLVMAVLPGAMNAGLVNVTFWVGMIVALSAAFVAAYPVNRFLLARGKGHALTHGYHGTESEVSGYRRFVPSLSTGTLASALVAFMLGGMVVSIADELGSGESSSGEDAVQALPARIGGTPAAGRGPRLDG